MAKKSTLTGHVPATVKEVVLKLAEKERRSESGMVGVLIAEALERRGVK